MCPAECGTCSRSRTAPSTTPTSGSTARLAGKVAPSAPTWKDSWVRMMPPAPTTRMPTRRHQPAVRGEQRRAAPRANRAVRRGVDHHRQRAEVQPGHRAVDRARGSILLRPVTASARTAPTDEHQPRSPAEVARDRGTCPSAGLPTSSRNTARPPSDADACRGSRRASRARAAEQEADDSDTGSISTTSGWMSTTGAGRQRADLQEEPDEVAADREQEHRVPDQAQQARGALAGRRRACSGRRGAGRRSTCRRRPPRPRRTGPRRPGSREEGIHPPLHLSLSPPSCPGYAGSSARQPGSRGGCRG